MRIFLSLCLGLAFGSSLLPAAEVPQITYVQRLVDQLSFRNPDVPVIAVRARLSGASAETVVASHGSPSGQAGLRLVSVPLRDQEAKEIGTLTFGFNASAGAEFPERCADRATLMRDQLARVIPSLPELYDVYDLASRPEDILAQRLIIDLSRRHPEVLVLAMHLKAPGEKDYKIWATNRPIILHTTESDQTDPNVGERGYSVLELFGQTHRMVAELPIRAVDGSVCGALVVLSLWQDESEMPGYLARAMAVRDELQSRIPNYHALFER